MRILILGPTGRLGRILVDEALKRGHQVNVLVSHEYRLKTSPSLLKVFEGTPLNQYTVAEAMQGCDAVMSALNISRTSDFPWASLRTGREFMSISLKNILGAMEITKVKRIIITTAWGVAETRKDIPFWFRWLIEHSNIRYPYLDHERQEELIKLSDTAWTVVRPVGLTNSLADKPIRVTLENKPKPRLQISRSNTAGFMLDVLEQDLYVHQFPVISEE